MGTGGEGVHGCRDEHVLAVFWLIPENEVDHTAHKLYASCYQIINVNNQSPNVQATPGYPLGVRNKVLYRQLAIGNSK